MPKTIFPAVIELSSLNGKNGFKINGEVAGDLSGYSVSYAGDFNGDGIADLIIEAPRSDPSGKSNAGSTYIVFGKNEAWPSILELSSLDGISGFKINGEASDDQSVGQITAGRTLVRNAGDINGDGLDDIIIGASYATPNGKNAAGSSYVIFGANEAWPSILELSTLDGTNGFKINGEVAGDQSGFSVSGAGDINDDGFDDVIIGAPYADPNGKSNAGSSYVIFGKNETWITPFELSTLNGENGFKINGISSTWSSGRTVSYAGDINNDGIDDFIIGESFRCRVIFGKNETWVTPLELSALDGIIGFSIYSGDGPLTVSSAGDINGDRIDDLIIGNPYATPNGKSYAGSSYVIFGKTDVWSATLILSMLDGTNGFRINGEIAQDYSGLSINYAGDVNGDGFDDIIIGAFYAASNGKGYAGSSYVIFGKTETWPSVLELSILNGINGFKVNGEAVKDYSGRSVSQAGDINGDGISDFIIGAYEADPNGKGGAGSSYVIFGDSSESFDESDFEFTANQLTVSEGETKLITLFNLNATDAQHDDLRFTIADLQYGRFEYVSQPGVSINDFSKENIANNQIQFVHTGDIFAPAYNVIVHREDKLASAYYSGAQAATINFTPINDLPILTVANGPMSYLRNDPPTIIDSGMMVTDADHANLTSATVAITNNFILGEDVLSFTNQNNITGVYDNTTGVLTLTGTSSIANYQTALRNVKYQNILNEPTNNPRNISFIANDGQDDSLAATRSINIIITPTTTFPPVLELSSLNGVNGFKIIGEVAGDYSGYSVSSAGDINGDGFNDIIIGAYYADPNGKNSAGSSYIIFGHNGTWMTPFELSTLDGINGFKINGEAAFDWSGYSVSSAGDINGDGFDDIVIGAYSADPDGKSYAGSSYVIFGHNETWSNPFELSTLNGTNGFRIDGETASDCSGTSVSSAGDINGDGFDDIIIGAWRASPNGKSYAGSSYLIFGHHGAWVTPFELSSLNGINGCKINGETADDYSGRSVSGAGDINGDGFDDIIIGADGADPSGKFSAGSSYVIFGHNETWPSVLELSTLNGTNGFKINGDLVSYYSGASVSSAGDINGDGIGDLVIGAYQSAGISYVIFGKNSTWITPLELSTLNGINGFKINGEVIGDYSGRSVSSAGDINGDGFDDIIIGADGSDPFGRDDAGSSYVVYGKAGPWPTSLDLINLDGTNGFKIRGEVAGDYSSYSVSYAGDINGDGISDIIIGAFYADPNGKENAGASYVIFGNNFTPVLTGSGGSFDYVENDPATVIDSAIIITDIDSINLTGATVSIITGFQSDSDELVFENQNGINGSYNSETGVLTLTGSSSLANYQEALRSVKYHNILGNLMASSRTISFMVTDGTKNSMTVTRSINIIPVNDVPVITVTSDALNYTENDGVKTIDSMLAVTDPDNINLTNATISIANNFHADQDQLEFTDQNGIVGDYDHGAGVLTLTGISSLENYQTALRNITYENLSDNPATDTRTISIATYDGEANSELATRDIHIIAVNDLPVLTSSGDTINYTENESAKIIDANIVITDFDNADLTNATIAITDNFDPIQDRLIFENQNGILGDYQNTTGILTLTGSTTVANYQTALKSIKYENLSDDPVTATRTVSFQVNDGEDNSLPLTRDITITAVNDIPVLTGSSGTLSYTENNEPKIVDDNIEIIDLDHSNLTNATVAITNNFNPTQDRLIFENQNGILGNYQNTTGILTLFGTTSLANYQTALKSIKYENLSDDPETSARTITFQVSDGEDNSLPITRDIQIIAVNDVPVVKFSAGMLNYTEKVSPQNIDANLTVTDVDNTVLTGATVTITNYFNAAQDVLHFENQNGISGDYNSNTGILTLTGTASIENYQTALRSVKYENPSDNPTTDTRTISMTVNDGSGNSNPDTKNIAIQAINDMPVLVNNRLTLIEADQITFTAQQLSATDVDNNDEDLIFTVNNVAHGNFQSKQTNQTVTAFAQRDITQGNILFIHDGKNDAPNYTVQVSDGENETNTTSAIINFTPVNDPPVIEKNELAITQGKRVFITTNEMRASDEETSAEAINLMVNNIQHGYFENINQPNIAITMFLQQAVIAGNQIQFIHDDSDQPPGYVVSANDGILTSQLSEATVHFVKKPPVGEDDDLLAKLSAPVVSGILGLFFLALKIYLNRKAAKSLKKLMEETEVGTLKQQAEFQQNVVRPVFKALYERINMKGCLGYTDDETMKRYLDAVTCVIDRIDEEGVDIKLNEMAALDQARVINAIVHETRRQFVLDYAFCSCGNLAHFFKSFFVPDMTPQELERHAKMIAINVRKALQQRRNTPARMAKPVEEIELADVKVKSDDSVNMLKEHIAEAVRIEMQKEKQKEKQAENQAEKPKGRFGFFDQHDPGDEVAIEGQPSANESPAWSRRISSPT